MTLSSALTRTQLTTILNLNEVIIIFSEQYYRQKNIKGVYKIQVRLWESEPDDLDNPSINPIISCETPDFIQNEGDPTNPDSFIFGAGSIWTFMVTTDNVNTCKISYDEDSNANSVNIFLLVPQYVVITVGEVRTLWHTNEIC